ncbi:MAG: SMC-Scp complex subunit ScpB [Bacteroidia bacterium]
MARHQDLTFLRAQIEALIFASEKPMPLTELQRLLSNYHEYVFEMDFIKRLVDDVQQDVEKRIGGFELCERGGGYGFYSRPDYHDLLEMAAAEGSRKRLSTAALETLSIIAYKQPVTKSELESIRGVNCDYSIQRLLEKNLISLLGRSEGPGRPTLYGTSDFFMEYFGINGLHELPQLKELESGSNEIGQASENE